MPDLTSDAVRDAGAHLVILSDADFGQGVMDVLASFFPGFSVGSAAIRDADGNQSEPIDAVISVTPIENGIVPADSAACTVLTCKTLDAASLRRCYDVIAKVKELKKAPSPNDARSTITMGLVVAAASTMNLADLAQEVRSLNATVGVNRHPDMVCVLTLGTVGYGMQLPGDQGVGGWLPPSESEREFYPPLLLHMLTVSSTTYAFNQIVAYIIGQLAFFAPGTPIPSMPEIGKEVPKQRNIVATYQYNLAGQFFETSAVEQPIHPYAIDDLKRNRLLKLAFIPWQDGGVIIAEGKASLNGMLMLAGRKLPLVIHKTMSGQQLSSLLSMDANGFIDFMGRVAKRMRGVVVRKASQQFQIAKLLDEGTSSPFGARILMTPLMLRDHALHDKAQVAKFDEVYQFTFNHLIELRKLNRDMVAMWQRHAARVESGEAVRLTNAIEVAEPIDQQLEKYIRDLIMGAARVAKKYQKLTEVFEIDIGFLFQKQKQFDKGLADLATRDPQLAVYVKECRAWLEPLRLMRDELEHGTYVQPKLRYEQGSDGKVHLREPQILGLPFTDYFATLLSHLNRFVEEVVAWCVQRTLDKPMIVTEIPISKRDLDKVERFKVTIDGFGEVAWVITYSDDDFDKV